MLISYIFRVVVVLVNFYSFGDTCAINNADSSASAKFSIPKVAHTIVKRSIFEDFGQHHAHVFKKVKPSQMKVGIVGAGLSGLYAGLLLQDLGVNYEILEASERIGGRIYSHHFESRSKSDYVELGAMRFPNLPEFERIIGNQKWSLINYLNSKVTPRNRIKMMPFTMSHPNNVFHFNNKTRLRSEVASGGDKFGFGISDGGYIDDKFTKKNFMFWDRKAMNYLNQGVNGDLKSGVNFLLNSDYETYRGFLMNPKRRQLAYPSDVLDWIEALDAQTGRYSMSVMDAFLMYRFFTNDMKAVDGGSTRIINAMQSLLKSKPKLKAPVESIRQDPYHNLIVSTNRDQFNYSHVILTPVLQVLRDIHFDCDLHLKKRVAIRSVGSGMLLMKIGIKFKSRFWENPELMNGKPIFGGVSLTDLRIREVVYPSHGMNCTSCPGVLIVGYIQMKEAVKYVGFTDEELIQICLEDLSKLHGNVVYEQFSGEYKVMQWSKNKWQQGGFISFEPGHYANLYPHLIHPDAKGRLYLAGDTVSVYHNWSIGSLVSAYRAVRDILTVNGMNDTISKLEKNWGTIDEPDFTHFHKH